MTQETKGEWRAPKKYELTASQVPIVPFRREFPGIRVRMLADRDAGVVVWESYLLDDAGTVTVIEPAIRLGLHHLIHLEGIIDLLLEARDALSPRRRLDMTTLEAPSPDVSESIQAVEG